MSKTEKLIYDALYDALYQALPVVETMLVQYSQWGVAAKKEARVLRGIVKQAKAALKKADEK